MPDLHHALHTHFGFNSFRPGQDEAITNLLDGQHTLVVMPTGSGKSLIYQLAALCLPAQHITLVLSPLIALMKDQVDSLNQRSIPATYINSSLSASEQSNRLHALTQGAYRLVYIAPERLRSVQFRQALHKLTIGLLAVDEAHCISHWGHDFRPDYRRIATAREDMGNPLTVALTATATRLVQDDIVQLLNINDGQRIVTGFNRPNIGFEVLYASDVASRQRLLMKLLTEAGFRHTSPESDTNADASPSTQNGTVRIPGTAIIYTGTRRDAEEVAELATNQTGIRAACYHAGMSNDQRTSIQNKFQKGKLPIVVATNAFGMGIDRPDVRLVIHYALPGSLESYYQEAGRAGRDGRQARAVLIYSPQDRLLQQWFIENNTITSNELQSLYRFLRRPDEPVRGITLDALAMSTGMDVVKARTGLALLERSEVIEHLGDEGAYIQVRVNTCKKQVINDICALAEEYTRHRQALLDQMTDYAESDRCRRRILLDYFSDRSSADADICCDNCTAEQMPPPEPGTDVAAMSRSERAALVILDALKRLKWGIGKKRLSEILKGSQSKTMTDVYRQSTYYGRFAEFSRPAIQDMIEQLVVQGYIKIIGGDLPVLHLTHRGQETLRVRGSIALQLPERNSNDAPRERTSRYAHGSTTAETYALFTQGVLPADIAQQRGLKERTIYSHLASLIGEGKIELGAVVADDVAQQVQAVIDELGDTSRLTPIKERLPDAISFDEIKCVVEDVRRMRSEKTVETTDEHSTDVS